MASITDHIMVAARTLADIQTAHAEAIRAYGRDEGTYDNVRTLSNEWVAAEHRLRALVESKPDRERMVTMARDLLDGSDVVCDEYLRGMTEVIVRSTIVEGEDADVLTGDIERQINRGL